MKNEEPSQSDDFFRRIGLALGPYQLIEEYLKFYIEVAHTKIEKTLNGRIAFRYPRKEYENAPLERLITMFSRHSDNDDLVTRLRAALKDRNYIAHSSIGHYRREKNPETAESILGQLQKLEDGGYDLIEDLN